MLPAIFTNPRPAIIYFSSTRHFAPLSSPQIASRHFRHTFPPPLPLR
jgi:hypothetical protein